jgi:hypothetical protein
LNLDNSDGNPAVDDETLVSQHKDCLCYSDFEEEETVKEKYQKIRHEKKN